MRAGMAALLTIWPLMPVAQELAYARPPAPKPAHLTQPAGAIASNDPHPASDSAIEAVTGGAAEAAPDAAPEAPTPEATASDVTAATPPRATVQAAYAPPPPPLALVFAVPVGAHVAPRGTAAPQAQAWGITQSPPQPLASCARAAAAPFVPAAPPPVLASPAAAQAALRLPAATRPLPRPARAPASDTVRCTADNRLCIRAAHYTADVCAAIDTAATEAGIDPHFLARLLWRESLFEPSARSPVGAQGIAQFMPGTAQMVGLDDPYNPAKAIHASAHYLRRLSDGFGNIGLAAVAYNGGENRAANFKAGRQQRLPFETQDYVIAITGHDALSWRDAPPATVDLRLAGETPFRDACMTLASARGGIRSFATPSRAWPWGVIVASHPQRAGADRQVAQLNRQLRPILGGRPVEVLRKRMSGSGRTVYTAQVGYDSRSDAMAFCNRLKAVGGRCIVLRN